MLPGFTRPEPARNSPGFAPCIYTITSRINAIRCIMLRPRKPARNSPGTRPGSIWRDRSRSSQRHRKNKRLTAPSRHQNPAPHQVSHCPLHRRPRRTIDLLTRPARNVRLARLANRLPAQPALCSSQPARHIQPLPDAQIRLDRRPARPIQRIQLRGSNHNVTRHPLTAQRSDNCCNAAGQAPAPCLRSRPHPSPTAA